MSPEISLQPGGIGFGKPADLRHGQPTLLRFFPGIHLQQEGTRPLCTTIPHVMQMHEEVRVCRINSVKSPEDGVVLVGLESTDIPDNHSATLMQRKHVFAHSFLKVVLADFGRPGIDSFQNPGKGLRLRHTDNMRFAGLTRCPAIRHTGSLADFRETLSYRRAHIRR